MQDVIRGEPTIGVAPGSNILALPLVSATLLTGNNEDWIDGIKWVVGEDPDGPQLDLDGIDFEMEIRRAPSDHEVMLRATTDDGSLAFVPPPDIGFLFINVSYKTMKLIWPGRYVGDIVAKANGYRRRCLTFDLEIVEGITR